MCACVCVWRDMQEAEMLMLHWYCEGAANGWVQCSVLLWLRMHVGIVEYWLRHAIVRRLIKVGRADLDARERAQDQGRGVKVVWGFVGQYWGSFGKKVPFKGHRWTLELNWSGQLSSFCNFFLASVALVIGTLAVWIFLHLLIGMWLTTWMGTWIKCPPFPVWKFVGVL